MIKFEGSHVVFNGPENRIISIAGFNNDMEVDAFITEAYQNIRGKNEIRNM